jgi:triosephosphate isomerase
MVEMTSQTLRRKLFIGNWKLNLTAPEARLLVRQLRARIDRDSEILNRDRDLVLAPPLLAIPAVSEELAGSCLRLAAQNIYCEDHGPFTDEVSAPMLKVFGVTYAIVGHSERRDVFKEDDELANRKLLSALEHGFIPVLCVGEHRDERGTAVRER